MFTPFKVEKQMKLQSTNFSVSLEDVRAGLHNEAVFSINVISNLKPPQSMFD